MGRHFEMNSIIKTLCWTIVVIATERLLNLAIQNNVQGVIKPDCSIHQNTTAATSCLLDVDNASACMGIATETAKLVDEIFSLASEPDLSENRRQWEQYIPISVLATGKNTVMVAGDSLIVYTMIALSLDNDQTL